MKRYELEFLGYTWDEYFYVIANKTGILVAYKGELDSEGSVKLNEIVYVDEADELIMIYESKQLDDIRKNIDKRDRLFFSYAEMKKEGRIEAVRTLKRFINSDSSNVLLNVSLSCKGACALFPSILTTSVSM